jgi:hypothetical protein
MKHHFLLFFLLSSLGHAQAPAVSSAPNWNDAAWIGYTADGRDVQFSERSSQYLENKPVQRRTYVSPLLRTEFRVDQEVRSAKAWVCGLGLYELYFNGERIGDRVLDPAQTTYDKRAFYVEHDVTDQLIRGENVVGLMLGNGFYGQNFAFGGGLGYGAPRAKMVIELQYIDGASETIFTTSDWKAAQSPVLFDNLYAGETYDARMEQAQWSSPGFNDSHWAPVEVMPAPTENLIRQEMEPIRKIRAIQPVAVLPAANGEWILDMGENLTGWLQIRVSEAPGTAITMRFAEHLMPDRKSIDTASTGVRVTSADQTAIYICKGGGPEDWEPRFTYHGFRYVQISGLSKKPALADFTGWLVRTDMERIGSFRSSDEIINNYYEVSLRTIEGNLQGLLSDCPHRERCAWMGDMHAVGEAASSNFDLRKFWRKTSADMETVLGADRVSPDSNLPRDPRAPTNIGVGRRLCSQAHPDWGAATVLVPWFSYLYYGDLEIVRDAWPMMKGWMDFLAEFAVKDGIIEEGFGDWCPPGSNSKIDTPVALTSTALYYQSLVAMRRMAEALDKPEEAASFAKEAAAVKEAFNARFYEVSEMPVDPVPKDSTIVITKALYGVPSKQIALTEKVRALVAAGNDKFKINNAFAGKDPAPGERKQFELAYTINGESKRQTLNENEDAHFHTKSMGCYGSQTGSALALHSGLVPSGEEQSVADGLAARIMKKSRGRYTTGIFGHRPLYTVLNDYGHAEVTRHLWHVEGWPSLRFMTEEHGLTTWPEVPFNWPAGQRYRPNSFNHPMHSGFAVAFHESLGGIRPDPENPGFKSFLLKPCFLPGLEWVKAEHRSPYGLISSHWKKEAGQVVWTVTVPPDTTAEVWIPTSTPGPVPENRQPVDQQKGIRLLRNQSTYQVYEAAAGNYVFSFAFQDKPNL